MMSVVPYLRSRRSSKWPLESMRSITAWFRRGAAASRAGSGSGLRIQRTALDALADRRPHAREVERLRLGRDAALDRLAKRAELAHRRVARLAAARVPGDREQC